MYKILNDNIFKSRPKNFHYAVDAPIDGKVKTLCGQIFRDAITTHGINIVDCKHCCRIFDRQFEQLSLF